MFTLDEDNRKLLEFERKIRDPVHDYIPVTALECHLIDTPAFQRLDRISQMHTVHKVYPGADYSRKVHSLGAMHLAGMAITRILYFQDDGLYDLVPSVLVAGQQSRVGHSGAIENLGFLRQLPAEYEGDWETVLDDLVEDKGKYVEAACTMEPRPTLEAAAWIWQAARLTALLHDCGHGPFSHLLENIDGVEFDHEQAGVDVVESIGDEAAGSFADEEETFVRPLLDFVRFVISHSLDELAALGFFQELVNSPFDCDMLDYIVRDAYFAGTLEYGQADVNRMVTGFVVDGGRLKMSKSQIPAMANAFEALFNMYHTVYFHKTARMFNVLLQDAFAEVSRFIQDISDDSEEFVTYDEGRLISEIRRKARQQSRGERDPVDGNDFEACWKLLEQFMNREKPYQLLASEIFAIDVQDIHGSKRPLKDAKETVEEGIGDFVAERAESGVEIKFDGIQPIKRISEDLKWVGRDVLYTPDPAVEDPDDEDHFANFASINREVADRLTRAEIPIHLFVSRDVDGETVASLRRRTRTLFDDIRDELMDDSSDERSS